MACDWEYIVERGSKFYTVPFFMLRLMILIFRFKITFCPFADVEWIHYELTGTERDQWISTKV